MSKLSAADRIFLEILLAAAFRPGENESKPIPKAEDFPFVGKVNGKPVIGGFDVGGMKDALLGIMDAQPIPKDFAPINGEIIFNHPDKGEQKVFEVTNHYLT